MVRYACSSPTSVDSLDDSFAAVLSLYWSNRWPISRGNRQNSDYSKRLAFCICPLILGPFSGVDFSVSPSPGGVAAGDGDQAIGGGLGAGFDRLGERAAPLADVRRHVAPGGAAPGRGGGGPRAGARGQ